MARQAQFRGYHPHGPRSRTALTAKNRFPMPFMMGADRAARIIADGLERRPAELTFPFPMQVLMHFARIVPNWLYDLVIGRASPMKS